MSNKKSYDEFKAEMRRKESSNRYFVKNKYGFLGAYQFGYPRLFDLGYADYDRDSKRFKFKKPIDEITFLTSPALQEQIFDEHVADYKKRILAKYKDRMDTIVFDVIVTLSGCIAVCHLLGFGGLQKLLDKGEIGQDANKTTALDYMSHFTAYDI